MPSIIEEPGVLEPVLSDSACDVSNPRAVRDLPAEHVKWAYGIARAIHRKIPGSFDLDDLQQIAILKTWQKWKTWDPAKNDKFQGYAYLAVSGQVKMALRRQNWFEHSDVVSESSFEHGLTALAKAPDNPEVQLQERETELQFIETTQLLKTAIENLPPIERYIIQALFLEGVTLKQVVCEVATRFPLAIPRLTHKRVTEIRDQTLTRLREDLGVPGSIMMSVPATRKRFKSIASKSEPHIPEPTKLDQQASPCDDDAAVKREGSAAELPASDSVAESNRTSQNPGEDLASDAHHAIGDEMALDAAPMTVCEALGRLSTAALLAAGTIGAGIVAQGNLVTTEAFGGEIAAKDTPELADAWRLAIRHAGQDSGLAPLRKSSKTPKNQQRKTINLTYELWREINIESAMSDEGMCEVVHRAWNFYKREKQGGSSQC